MENAEHPRALLASRHTTSCGAGPSKGRTGNGRSFRRQIAHDGPRALKFAEFAEDEAEPGLHLLIGIEDDLRPSDHGYRPAGTGRRNSPRAAF